MMVLERPIPRLGTASPTPSGSPPLYGLSTRGARRVRGGRSRRAAPPGPRRSHAGVEPCADGVQQRVQGAGADGGVHPEPVVVPDVWALLAGEVPSHEAAFRGRGQQVVGPRGRDGAGVPRRGTRPPGTAAGRAGVDPVAAASSPGRRRDENRDITF